MARRTSAARLDPGDRRTGSEPAYPNGPVWSLRRVRQDPIAFLTKVSRLGDVAPFTIAGRRAFLLTHPRDIERVLVADETHVVKAPAFRRASRLLGNGLLTAEGAHHRRRRRVVQPAFRHDRVAEYGSAMAADASRACLGWRDGTTVDVAREMQSLTATIAAHTLFGVELEETAAITDAVRAAAACIDPLLTPVAPPGQLAAIRGSLLALIDSFVERRGTSNSDRGDLLSLLLRADAEESDASAQLRDDALTMFLAAHDTIAHALTWTWTLLAGHRDAEERLHRELDATFEGRLPLVSDMASLPFTRAVFAEALRLCPPAWVIVRRAIRDCRAGDVEMPAGSLLFVSQFLTHRDERFFSNPLAFRPERWLGHETPPWPKFAYFPFGFGPRACIGEGFAWMEGVLVLATISRRWRLCSLDGHAVAPDPRITLRPNAALMRLERRHPQPAPIRPSECLA